MKFEPRSRLVRRLAGFVVIVSVVVTYLIDIVPGESSSQIVSVRHEYHLVRDAFLAGQLYLTVAPSRKLLALKDPMDPEANFLFRLHDASLYNNRYYLYFGPVPTLALFIPYRLLTHADLPPAAALLLLESAGFLLSVLALFQLFAAWRLEPPLWLQLCAISSLGISQLSPYLLQLADVYEIAVASGYAFTMAARLRLVRAPRGYRPVRDMLLGGLLLGLACGCRPDFLVVMCAIAALNGFAWFKRRLPMRAFVAYVAPAFLCGVALAAYNYARFGNPLEFGLKYQLSGGAAVIGGPHASLRNAAAGLYFFNLIAS